MAAKNDTSGPTPLEVCERALRKAEITQIVLASIGLLVLVLGNVVIYQQWAAWTAGTVEALVIFLYARQVSVATQRRLAYRDQIHDLALVQVNDILRQNVHTITGAALSQSRKAP